MLENHWPDILPKLLLFAVTVLKTMSTLTSLSKSSQSGEKQSSILNSLI